MALLWETIFWQDALGESDVMVQLAISVPAVTSLMMSVYEGEVPGAKFAVAVSATSVPTGTDVEVADKPTLQPVKSQYLLQNPPLTYTSPDLSSH